MHFVDVERSCKVSGGTTYLLLLAQGLAERGHQFTLAAREGALSSSFAEAGARYLRTWCWPFSIPQISSYLRDRPADVFLCSGRGRARLAALSLAERFRRPCICSLHDPLWPGQTLPDMLRPTALVALEEPIYEGLLALGVPAERVHLWPRPVRCRELSTPPAEGFQVLHLGRLSESKWHSAAALIEAIPGLLEAVPDLRVTIVGGGGKLATVRQLAAAANARCSREVIAAVGEMLDPLSWIERANLVVAGGYACLEALYNGRPALGSGFGWFGPVTRGRMAEAVAQHFGDRSPEEGSASRMRQAILELREALRDPQSAGPYLPRPDWFSEDHSPAGTALLMETLAAELVAQPSRPR